MDEYYILIFVYMLYGEMSVNWSLIWVDWFRVGLYFVWFIWFDVIDEFFNCIWFIDKCLYYGKDSENIISLKCVLFVRKFIKEILEFLLRIFFLVFGFGF